MGAGVGVGGKTRFFYFFAIACRSGFCCAPLPLFQLKILLPAKDALYPRLEVSLSLWGNSLKLVISYISYLVPCVFPSLTSETGLPM